MKKLVSVILSIFLVLSTLSSTAFAVENKYQKGTYEYQLQDVLSHPIENDLPISYGKYERDKQIPYETLYSLLGYNVSELDSLLEYSSEYYTYKVEKTNDSIAYDIYVISDCLSDISLSTYIIEIYVVGEKIVGFNSAQIARADGILSAKEMSEVDKISEKDFADVLNSYGYLGLYEDSKSEDTLIKKVSSGTNFRNLKLCALTEDHTFGKFVNVISIEDETILIENDEVVLTNIGN